MLTKKSEKKKKRELVWLINSIYICIFKIKEKYTWFLSYILIVDSIT